jgi:predicted RNA polymerase sigma factor
VGRAKIEQLGAAPAAGEPADDTLDVIFLCCHPALSREAQIALALRVVCGLSVAEIARAFLVQETTVAQRISRAKRKIVQAGLPLRRPAPEEIPARLNEVLVVVYLLFNEGYLATGGPRPQRPAGRDREAVRADERALRLAENPAERALLEQRLAASVHPAA